MSVIITRETLAGYLDDALCEADIAHIEKIPLRPKPPDLHRRPLQPGADPNQLLSESRNDVSTGLTRAGVIERTDPNGVQAGVHHGANREIGRRLGRGVGVHGCQHRRLIQRRAGTE